MSRWAQVDVTPIPNGGGELRLLQRDAEFAIRLTGGQGDLMNSRTHGSEDALGELAAAPLAGKSGCRILIGGLGMGFTLAAALARLPADTEVVVAELVPGVVAWNQTRLGDCAGQPLADPRVRLQTMDVRELIQSVSDCYHAIVLDVDNGPEGLTHPANDHLYSYDGLRAAYEALCPAGVLSVWSATPSRQFSALLKKVGFSVDERRVRAHRGKGSRHVIWLATRR